MSSRDAHEFAISTGSARVTWDGSHATVFVNGAESSSVDVDHPEVLEFEYKQHMDAALEALAPSPEPVRVLHIGGAGCALAWAWSIKRPQSRHCVVEIDEDLAHTVRDLFDLPRSPQLKIRVGEGRQVLDSTRPERWDVIVRDAFSDQSVPRQLMTLQAARSAWDALVPGGLYVANVPHGGKANGRPDVAAISEAFGEVVAVADPKVARSGRWGNVMVAGRKTVRDQSPHFAPLDVAQLDRLLRKLALPARIMAGKSLNQWIAGARPMEDPQGE